MLNKIVDTSSIWSNVFYVVPLVAVPFMLSLFPNMWIALSLILLAYSSSKFHYYSYLWGNPRGENGHWTREWRQSAGFFWQKIDVMTIYVVYGTILGSLLGSPLLGFIVGCILGYYERTLDYRAVAILILVSALHLAFYSLFWSVVVIALFSFAVIIRKECYENVILHSLWHLLTATATGILVYFSTVIAPQEFTAIYIVFVFLGFSLFKYGVTYHGDKILRVQ